MFVRVNVVLFTSLWVMHEDRDIPGCVAFVQADKDRIPIAQTPRYHPTNCACAYQRKCGRHGAVVNVTGLARLRGIGATVDLVSDKIRPTCLAR